MYHSRFQSRTPFQFALAIALAVSLAAVIGGFGAQASTPALVVRQETPPDPGDRPSDPEGEPPVDGAAAQAWSAWNALSDAQRGKVDPRVIGELRGDVLPAHLARTPERDALLNPRQLQAPQKTRFLVFLKTQPDLLAVSQQVYASQADRRRAVFDSLRQTAAQSQAPLVALLKTQMAQGKTAGYQPFFIVNALAVDGDLRAVTELAGRPDVDRIMANYPLVPIWGNEGAPGGKTDDVAGAALDAANWNIGKIQADRVWSELGVTGEGATVAGFDTGVTYTHPALLARYRGTHGSTVDHNYNWFEPDTELRPDGALGPSASAAPYDCDTFSTHGTHTMGTMVGDGGMPGTQIGVAPGAKWIAVPGICENTSPGGIEDDIGALKAFQWLMCPTDLTGDLSTADCSKAPDVINNSWGSSNPVDQTMRPAIQALRAAGIVPVFAAGNFNGRSGAIASPASVPEAIAVGAVNRRDAVAYFSGRGPSFYPGEQKPELTAPGQSVKSSVYQGDYDSYSGTSMAAPHVAGLIALMVSADLQDGLRDLNVDEIEKLMEVTALDLGAPGPDDEYGYGRIDAFNAVRWVLSAGDLRGTIRGADNGVPLDGAIVTGLHRQSGDSFTSVTDSSGVYSVTVPGGEYDVTVQAWGYISQTFPSQKVFSETLSVLNFELQPLPTGKVGGVVQSGGQRVGGAHIYVSARPSMDAVTGQDGTFILNLPTGIHELTVEAPGYRIAHSQIEVPETGLVVTIPLTPAPSILLIDPGAKDGWFDGWPIYAFFEWALATHDYAYDLWRIRYTDFNDTQPLPDGSTGYGVPSADTLGNYDVVIWASRACKSQFFGCRRSDSPGNIGADDELMAFLDSGGRLLLSGQDLVEADSGLTYLKDYLQVGSAQPGTLFIGDALTGRNFLSGLELEITNAGGYGYANGWYDLDPGAVTLLPGPRAVVPVLTYAGEKGAAGAAISSCSESSYRAVLLAVGYENIAPMGNDRNPAISQLIDRSIAWLTGGAQESELYVLPPNLAQRAEPGQSVAYDFVMVNSGAQALTVPFSLQNNTWPVHVFEDQQELSGQILLPPCASKQLRVIVTSPANARLGDEDTVVFTFAPPGQPSQEYQLSTTALPQWKEKPAMPTSRYRLGMTSIVDQGQTYAIGGWTTSDTTPIFGAQTLFELAMKAVERYDACSDTWEQLPSLPEPAANVAAVALNGKIYVLGGHSYDFLVSDLVTKASVFVFDPQAARWTSGASLPEPLAGMAAAAANGKLYVFGGGAESGEERATTLEYDPATNAWAERASMPGGSRIFAGAAAMDNKIYVVGGWPNLTRVEVYDPEADSWTTATPLNVGRQSPGVVAAPDGFLYVAGGGSRWDGVSEVERYNPATEEWTLLTPLRDNDRASAGLAYAAGQIFIAGGADAGQAHDALRVLPSFCLSNLSAEPAVLQPGGLVTYTVTLATHEFSLPNASVVAPIPADTSFAGFGDNGLGATFNSAANQVEWHGQIDTSGDFKSFSYRLRLADKDWGPGGKLTHVVTFGDGQGHTFFRQSKRSVFGADFSASEVSTSGDRLTSGDVLTYTVDIRSRTPVGGNVSLRAGIPEGAAYVPGSLSYTVGSGTFNAGDDTVNWSGLVTSGDTVFVNDGDDYVWADSDGQGGIPGVEFQWIDVRNSGTFITAGDEQFVCGMPVGFDFTLYGEAFSEFCVNTNGFLTFDLEGYSDYSNDCPLPSRRSPASLIAAVWDDLVVLDGVYYQTLGAAPTRHLVVQWSDVRRYAGGSGEHAEFELILWENGTVQVQVLRAGVLNGYSSTTGLEDSTENRGVTYACNSANSLHDELAVKFVPPDGFLGSPSARVSYGVTIGSQAPANTVLTNTVVLTAPKDVFTWETATLINTIDLAASYMKADAAEASPNQTINYTVVMQDTGLVNAPDAHLTNIVPAELTYVAGSLACSAGLCGEDGGTITWDGELAVAVPVTLTYRAQLTALLADKTPVANVAQLDDGTGMVYELTSTVLARRPDLHSSFIEVVPELIYPGDLVTVTTYIRNSGSSDTTAEMQQSLPPELTFDGGSLVCGTGTCWRDAAGIHWSGTVIARGLVPVRFRVIIPENASMGQVFTSDVTITDMSWGIQETIPAAISVARALYIPLVGRSAAFASSIGSHMYYLPLIAR